jgi:hypothetical protein
LNVIGKLDVKFSAATTTSRRLTAATVKILDVFLLILSFRFAHLCCEDTKVCIPDDVSKVGC